MTALRTERRSAQRYRLELDVSYEVFHRDHVAAAGKARTRNLSKTGVLFDAGRRVKSPLSTPGAIAKLSIDWPARYDGVTPIELQIIGKVVRADHHGTAIKIMRHGFERLDHSAIEPAAMEQGGNGSL